MRILPTLLATAATLAVAGCSTFHTAGKNTAETNLVTADVDASLAQMRRGSVSKPGFELIDDADYIEATPKRIGGANSLPVQCDIEFRPGGPVTLLQVGQKITKDCGIQVRVTADAMAALSGSQDPGQGALPAGPPTLVPPLIGGGMGAVSSPSFSGPRSDQVQVSYKGDVAGLLNAVATRLGLSWKYRDGGITVFELDTRTYRLFSIPSGTNMTNTVTSGTSTATGVSGGAAGGTGSAGGSTGGVSGNSGTQQSTTVSLVTTPDDDLRKTIESMLTKNKGRMAFSRSNSMLSVTDTPEVLDRVGELVNEMNSSSTTQVLLNIKVMTVTLADTDEFGINWNSVYTNLAKNYGLGLANAFQTSADAVTGSVNVLEGSSRFSGSSLIINALQKQGHVSMVTQPSVTTLNYEPVPVQVAQQTGYIAQTTTTLTGGQGDFAQTSRTPGTVTTGFNMNLLPYVLPDSKTILLSFTMTLASPPQFRGVGDENSRVELPDFSSRTFSQKVKLKSGETLILSGFEQTGNDTTRSGIGSPRNFLMGGGRRSTRNREVVVVLITPQVQE
ncbi:PilN family type IVB pilus formation outer membrane protein [Xanthomonas campestris pv. campestris]|uniref:PilN family type IVB pilus formation outer membrane protein n=1 Tax=Xanthomonas campestris TaxID=339 RepID=UPI001E5DB733|nr:PilN family type IVB pilus formation outer membrane protein [Xanthomonas campestris]MCD0253112.1 PilN family type IVB pilus formation outer membrane protein [Xanthomonas campestris pv. campestris]